MFFFLIWWLFLIHTLIFAIIAKCVFLICCPISTLHLDDFCCDGVLSITQLPLKITMAEQPFCWFLFICVVSGNALPPPLPPCAACVKDSVCVYYLCGSDYCHVYKGKISVVLLFPLTLRLLEQNHWQLWVCSPNIFCMSTVLKQWQLACYTTNRQVFSCVKTPPDTCATCAQTTTWSKGVLIWLSICLTPYSRSCIDR